MSFFEPPPPPPSVPEFPEPDPIGRYVPGVVALERIVGRNEKVAVVVRSLEAFPDGVAFKVETFVRNPDPFEFGFGPMQARHRAMLHMHAALRAQAERTGGDAHDTEAIATVGEAPGTSSGVGPVAELSPFDEDHEVQFGVQFPDGTKVTTLRPYVPDMYFDLDNRPDDDAGPRYGLEQGGGGGSPGHMVHDYFCWPIPESGQLTLVCAWPFHDLGESSIVIDTQAIRDAAERSQPVWPEDAGRPSRHDPMGFITTMRRHQRDADRRTHDE